MRIWGTCTCLLVFGFSLFIRPSVIIISIINVNILSVYFSCRYISKQSYYIKCGPCCHADGVVASGVDGDVQIRAAQAEKDMAEKANTDTDGIAADGEEAVDAREEDEAEEEEVEEEGDWELLRTQEVRVFWEAVEEEEEDEEEEKGEEVDNGRPKRRKISEAFEDEQDRYMDVFLEKQAGAPLDYVKCIGLVTSHPAYLGMLNLSSEAGAHGSGRSDVEKKKDIAAVQTAQVHLVSMQEKAANERYRGGATFITDLKYYLSAIQSKASKPSGGRKSAKGRGVLKTEMCGRDLCLALAIVVNEQLSDLME